MKRLLVAGAILLFSKNIFAQQILNEGRVVYDIIIDNNAQQIDGTLEITVKNDQLKRAMEMSNGLKNTIYYNQKTNESKVYNDFNGQKIGKELNSDAVKKQHQKFKNATYNYTKEKQIIAGYECEKVVVKYPDGSANEVYVYNGIVPANTDYNAMFDELKGIPLQYQVLTGNNIIILKAKSVDLIPIENAVFKQPSGYTFISNELK